MKGEYFSSILTLFCAIFHFDLQTIGFSAVFELFTTFLNHKQKPHKISKQLISYAVCGKAVSCSGQRKHEILRIVNYIIWFTVLYL
jgi:hypothetical protein